jgi:hypothetical protein
VLELARILARHADWKTMATWRPRARACPEIGSSRDPSRHLSITAYRAARQVLQDRGLLGLVAKGWTSALRAAVLDDRTATSAVFVWRRALVAHAFNLACSDGRWSFPG